MEGAAMVADQLTEQQKQTLTRLNSLVAEIRKAEELPQATSTLLAVIAKTLVLQLAEKHNLEGRLLPFSNRP
jgi:hypothetical protein